MIPSASTFCVARAVNVYTTDDTILGDAHIEYPEVLLDDVQRLMDVVQVGQRLRLGRGKDEAFYEAPDVDSYVGSCDTEPIGNQRLGMFLNADDGTWD